MATNFYFPSFSLDLFPKPFYTPQSYDNVNVVSLTSAQLGTNTYFSPFAVTSGEAYDIYSLRLTNARMTSSSATLTIRAVVYQESLNENEYLLVRQGSAVTISNTSAFQEINMSLTDGSGFPLRLETSQPGAFYFIGFQATLSTGNLEISYTLNDGAGDDLYDSFARGSKLATIPSGSSTTLLGQDFHMYLNGLGPPPTPIFTTVVRGDRSITWNFSNSGVTDAYTTRYAISTTGSATTPFPNIGSTTSFTGTSLTPGQSYYGFVYLENSYGTSPTVVNGPVTAIGSPTINSVSVSQGSGTSANQFSVSVNFTNNSSSVTNVTISPSGETPTVLTGTNLSSPQTASITTGWNKTVTFTISVTNGVGTTTTTTGSYIVPVQPQGPNPVTVITATATDFNPNQVIVTWQNPGVPSGSSAITAYRVERALATKSWNGSNWVFSASGSYTNVSGTLSSTTFTYTDNSASVYTAYMYRVVATNSTGDSINNTAIGVLTDGGRFFAAGAGGSFATTARYIEDPATGVKMRIYRYTGSGPGGWEPTPY